MLCEMIKFPSFFPNALKKKLFFNMLLVMMTTLTVFLGASECDILGHKIAVTFTYLQEASKLLALKVQPGQSQIDPQSVTDFVESLLTRDKTWLPLSIERAIVTSVAIIILTIFEEVFVDFHVNLIGAVVQFHLAPGPKHLRILPIEEYRSRALAVRGRTAGKRSQTPIIAKSKEVSRGQYIDALNAKKYEAEKQIRDIDIKLVEQTRLTRLSLQKGMMSIIALALGYWKCLDNKENLVDVEVKPASQTSSYLEPGQRPGQGRMSELLQSSKHRVSALSKITKYVIPKSVKKKFAFSASTKKCETKEDLVRQDHGMQSRSKST